MSNLSPVKLSPAFKDYLWGGTKLKEKYNKKSDLEIVAESWEMSCHKDGQSVVASGEYSGKTLSEYVEILGKSALGKKAGKFSYFPLLIKFIDAKDNLSIQVHPRDEYALRVEGEYGKTEMWYVLEAEEGAYLYYGFNRDITKEEFAERIKNNTILEVLNKVNVKSGDVFFIDAGTVHAIGAGLMICEIQQNSNTTYRVYDYDRRDKEGNARPLHVEKAIEVSKLTKAPELAKSESDVLASCEYFTVKKAMVNGETTLKIDESSFVSLIIVDGNGTIALGEDKIDVTKGDSIFVPAQNGEIMMNGEMEVIVSSL
ncbi:MAG: class I mannose-6-phosphate isomerase [Clostridia bacterium]|nr:class I mannose-6-phosphate isomerase [Clostridia bacterium]